MTTAREFLDKLERCGFENEAGPIELCTDWLGLKAALTEQSAEVESTKWENMVLRRWVDAVHATAWRDSEHECDREWPDGKAWCATDRVSQLRGEIEAMRAERDALKIAETERQRVVDIARDGGTKIESPMVFRLPDGSTAETTEELVAEFKRQCLDPANAELREARENKFVTMKQRAETAEAQLAEALAEVERLKSGITESSSALHGLATELAEQGRVAAASAVAGLAESVQRIAALAEKGK